MVNTPEIPGENAPRLPEMASAGAESPVEGSIAVERSRAANAVADLLNIPGEIDKIEGDTDKKILRTAWEYLQKSPEERNLAETRQHMSKVGEVMGGFYDIEKDILNAPAVVIEIHGKLELLYRQHHIASAKEELGKKSPDLVRILNHLNMASSNAAAMPVEIKKEIAQIREEIEQKKLQNEIYNRMCTLAGKIEGAIPLLVNEKTIKTSRGIIVGLKSGVLTYVGGISEYLKGLRADAGKEGAASQEVLRTTADGIEQFALQLNTDIKTQYADLVSIPK